MLRWYSIFLSINFDYLVPDHLEDSVELGKRVKAPFGQRSLSDYIVGLSERPPALDTRLKEIIGIIDEAPILSDRLMRLARWMSEYYLCPLGEAIGAFTPPGLIENAVILLGSATP